MSETLTFGPEWLRNLSSGNSVTSPPPSPGPKYKLAEHRYGKEEMLALFSEDVKMPEELAMFESICRSRPVLPLAFQPLTEEEQRNSVGSVNSNAVLKLMGRGGVRGGGPPRGPGRGGLRGRGRGDGGFTRQTSYEETRGEGGGGGGFGRGTDTRRPGWNESSRGGFERSPSLRETGPSGPGRGGYDPSLSRPRLSSDTSWERPDRRSDSGNWRSGTGGEEDDGWRISGQRSADRSEKWRGGSTRGRAPWRGGPDSYRADRSNVDDEWQTARSGRHSYHEHEEVRWSSSNERLPEWSNDDSDDFDTPGTFDSSGAFVSHKQKEERDRSKSERKSEEYTGKESRDRNKRSQSESDTSQNDDPDVWKEEEQEDDIFSDTGTKNISEETSQPSTQKAPPTEQAPDLAKKSSSPSISPTSEPLSFTSQNRQPVPTKPQSVAELAQAHVSPQPQVTLPPAPSQEDASVKKEDEPNMEHFAKAAESLVASLDDEDEEDIHLKDAAKAANQHQELRSSPTTPDEVQWSYTDPQGKVQGPFSNSEMADWFSHGYFTMGLLVKRTTDEAFQPLGEVIKQWGRVPFISGPQPPPFKGVPEHIHQQQQMMARQRQYQHLVQQHYLQQQIFHQQALLMQQQLQHNQQQMQQVQQVRQHSPPPNTSLSSPQHTQPPTTQRGAVPQQPARPQTLSPHTESIWGSNTSSHASQSMITPGPWSPVATTPGTKVWETEGSQQNVPSFEEIQRMEEEKEKKSRLEVERREAEERALRLKQEEEERRRLQELAMLKKQKEEEERRRQEEAERRRKEQEELRKKQQEEARRKQEEEIRRKQEQQEALRRQEQQRQQLELQQKEEQRRLNEFRQQQQQALLRLQQQQQDLMRKREMQQKVELQQQELQQKLQQKRHESQVTGSSLWGAPTPVSGTMSLAEIQQQEERERKQREIQLQQQLAAQQREQQTRGAPGWADRPPQTIQPVKSLIQIQQEQARQLDKRQQGPTLTRSQPSHNPLSSSVWGNTAGASLSASWGPTANSRNIWGTTPSKVPQQAYFDDDDDDDDSDDEANGGSFWDDAVKAAASKSRQQQRQQQAVTHQRQHQPSQQSSNKMPEKRTNRDEENLRRLFQQRSSVDEFSQWCYQSLRSLNSASTVDIPTFSAFLKEVESPYEVYDYVKQYLGDSRETREFAREFIEKRKKQREKVPVSVSNFPQASVWRVPVPRGPPSGRPTDVNQLSAFSSGAAQEDPQDAMNKKKRKKKMQKVDPSILGFSVNAADRVNMGEIQTVED